MKDPFKLRSPVKYCTYCLSNCLGEGEAYGPGMTISVVKDEECDHPMHDVAD